MTNQDRKKLVELLDSRLNPLYSKGVGRTSETVHWITQNGELVIEIREGARSCFYCVTHELLPGALRILIDDAKRAGFRTAYFSKESLTRIPI